MVVINEVRDGRLFYASLITVNDNYYLNHLIIWIVKDLSSLLWAIFFVSSSISY